MTYKRWLALSALCYGVYWFTDHQFDRIAKKLDQIPQTISSSLDSTRIEDNLINKFIDLSAADRMELLRSMNKERNKLAKIVERLELELKRLLKVQRLRRCNCGRKKR